jgi:hypothetical protein
MPTDKMVSSAEVQQSLSWLDAMRGRYGSEKFILDSLRVCGLQVLHRHHPNSTQVDEVIVVRGAFDEVGQPMVVGFIERRGEQLVIQKS